MTKESVLDVVGIESRSAGIVATGHVEECGGRLLSYLKRIFLLVPRSHEMVN